jgi:hypothetical protein
VKITFEWVLVQSEGGYGDRSIDNGFVLRSFHGFYTVTIRYEGMYVWWDDASKLQLIEGRTKIGAYYA